MYIDFSALFHQSSKDRTAGGRVKIPMDSSEWPEGWQTVSYKEYSRLQRIDLPQEGLSSGFADTVHKRISDRNFTGRPASITEISNLMKYSCGIIETPDAPPTKRSYPSGGARYPVEAYLLIFKGSESVPAGVYHYHVKKHALECLWRKDFSNDDIASFFAYDWSQKATGAIILTGVFHRNQKKYGERGYRHVLLEAGAIMQNTSLVSIDLGLKFCPLDGIRDEKLEELLDIDGFNESVLCAMLFGR